MKHVWRVVAIWALALAPMGLLVTGTSGAAPKTGPIGRAAARAGYPILHALPVPKGATRVGSIPRGILSVAGGELDYVGPTEVTDLKEFFRVSDGPGVATWLNARHSSRLSLNSEGSWGQWGVTKGYDSIWNVGGTKFPMQVAYNANAVSSGGAYLRVDVYVFWSPEFMALTAIANRVTLTVTNEVPAGTRTIHMNPDENGGSPTCTYKLYRAVIKPLETLSKPSRIANLESYVNTRTDWRLDNYWPDTVQTICSLRQVPPPTTKFALSFYAAMSAKPFAAIDGSISTVLPGSSSIAWVRSSTGALTAKSGLKGVSLSFLTTYLHR